MNPAALIAVRQYLQNRGEPMIPFQPVSDSCFQVTPERFLYLAPDGTVSESATFTSEPSPAIAVETAAPKAPTQSTEQPRETAERKPKKATATSSEEWEPPIPFHTTVLPAFPLDALPPVLRDYCGALATQTQTDNELAGLVVLGCCAAALAKKVRVQPKAGWIEPVNLYGMILQEPGTRKSAVIQKATKPFEEWEQDHRKTMLPIIKEAQTKYDIAQRRADRLKTEAAAEKDENPKMEEAAVAAALAADALRPPTLDKLLAEDVTQEKLVMLLSENDGRMGIITAEGGIIDIVCGRYSQDKQPNLDVFLKGHSGDLIKVDRVGREGGEIREPAITMILAVQRDVLHSMSKHRSVKGRGLLARFLYAVPSDRMGFRNNLAPAIPFDVKDRYNRLLHKLLKIPILDTPVFDLLTLTDEAHRLLFDFDKENEPELRRGGHFELYKDWMGKCTGATARLAAVLHCVEWIARGNEHGKYPPITAATMGSAIQLARFFMAHMREALYAMGNHDPVEAKAERIAAWLVTKKIHGITARELQQSHRDMFTRIADVMPVLQRLVEHGVLRLKQQVGSQLRGRPPAPTYARNPLWKG